MAAKFKVGDKVRFAEFFAGFDTWKTCTILAIDGEEAIVEGNGFWAGDWAPDNRVPLAQLEMDPNA